MKNNQPVKPKMWQRRFYCEWDSNHQAWGIWEHDGILHFFTVDKIDAQTACDLLNGVT